MATYHSVWRCQFSQYWRSVVIVFAHVLFIVILYRYVDWLTVLLMHNLFGDMGGSEATDPSGRKYLGFVTLLDQLTDALTTLIPLAAIPLIWAGFFEFLRTRSTRWHYGVVAFLGWLLITGLVYSALTYFATQDIAGYVAGRWEGTHPAIYAAVMRPILQRLVDGIGPTYVLGYSLQWATGLTALLALLWWWLHRRRRTASPREGVARE